MTKRLCAVALAALLLLSGCGASTARPADTVPPKQTEAPAAAEKPAETPAPTQTPVPTVTPAPAETPAPTEPPAPAENPLVKAAGVYKLYSFDTEGYEALASDDGVEAWILLRESGSADLMDTGPDGEFHEWRGVPVTAEADGLLRFETPEDFVAFETTGQLTPDGMLEVSLSLRNPDGTTGGSLHRYRRITEHEGAFNGRALTPDELDALNAGFEGMNFCTCTYACPEEIDWREVCYNGAGINEEPSETAWQEYLDDGGWGELDIEAIRDWRLREYVWTHTLTSYDLADTPLLYRWFGSSDGYYIYEHGDTNAIPVSFTEGYVDGELYKLYYERADWEHYRFDPRPFVLTAYIRDGEWQYVSNLPANWPEPKTLLTLRYFENLADAQALYDITSVSAPADEQGMEPSGWGYAVFTAQTDDVRYIVEMAEGYVNEGYDVLIPGDYVASGVLMKGQSAAVRTNQPWYAEMRLSATCGALYADYVFGQDNWKHLLNEDARRLVGHDLAGEGRGCTPATEEELSCFLMDGNWAMLDPATGEPVAAAIFHDYRSATFFDMEQGVGAVVWFDRYDARPTEAPDLLSLVYSDYDDYGWTLDGYAYGDPLGDYQIYMVQLDGEQILTLTQLSEGTGILSQLFPAADEGGAFTLHRFKGTAVFEGQG